MNVVVVVVAALFLCGCIFPICTFLELDVTLIFRANVMRVHFSYFLVGC